MNVRFECFSISFPMFRGEMRKLLDGMHVKLWFASKWTCIRDYGNGNCELWNVRECIQTMIVEEAMNCRIGFTFIPQDYLEIQCKFKFWESQFGTWCEVRGGKEAQGGKGVLGVKMVNIT